MPQTRQLAAIMFTDIVGYTALMGEDEQNAFQILNRNRELQKPIIEQYSGKWIKELGDGVMASFTTATDAVQCAISIQQACYTIPGLQLRIGIHLGDVVFENEDVFGDGVNIASRLQAIASPGAIYISETVHNNIANKKEINSKYVRAETLKNIKEPIRIYEVRSSPLDTLPGFNKKNYKPSPKRKKIIFGTIGFFLLLVLLGYYFIINKNNGNNKSLLQNSIAVLYFNNMSGDSTQEYFSDGITEEITSRLAKIGGLKVKSRTSVLQYKNQTKTAKLIAQELGVNNILEGSVRKQGSKVVITAQLINGETDEHIWSETYNREMKDIFEVQSDIAQQIAKKFQINLSDVTKKRLETAPTLNIEAYDLYLKASSLFYLGDGTGNNNKKSVVLLKQAIQLDPAFADAYALLSEAYVYISPHVLNPKQWLDSATIFGRKAIEISPDRESGYIAMAKIKLWQGLYDEALKWLFKAHDIKPFSINQIISSTYFKKNEYGKAYEWVRKAIAYDPAEPSNYSSEAGIFYKLGMLDSMKKCIDKARRLKNKSTDMDWEARNYYLFTGNEEEYIALCKKAFALDEKAFNTQMSIFYMMQRDWRKSDSLRTISSRPDDMDAGLAKIHSGKKEEGMVILKNTIDTRKSFLGFADEWHNFDISRCYAALQDSRYIYYFNKAVEKGWHDYTFLEHDPFFDFVRSTQEFKKLRQKIYERNERFKADLFAAIKRSDLANNN
ncbi:MAG: adenylate/guanylate cyclase domain-containing protein [Chitinophagaceae bacterium]